MKNIDRKIDYVFKYINELSGNSSDVTTRIIKIAQKTYIIKIDKCYIDNIQFKVYYNYVTK